MKIATLKEALDLIDEFKTRAAKCEYGIYNGDLKSGSEVASLRRISLDLSKKLAELRANK